MTHDRQGAAIDPNDERCTGNRTTARLVEQYEPYRGIDPNKPEEGNPTTESVRLNFVAIIDDLKRLDALITPHEWGAITGNIEDQEDLGPYIQSFIDEHQFTVDDIDGLLEALAGKADKVHSHLISDIDPGSGQIAQIIQLDSNRNPAWVTKEFGAENNPEASEVAFHGDVVGTVAWNVSNGYYTHHANVIGPINLSWPTAMVENKLNHIRFVFDNLKGHGIRNLDSRFGFDGFIANGRNQNILNILYLNENTYEVWWQTDGIGVHQIEDSFRHPTGIGTSAEFGKSVALSNNRDVLVIGAEDAASPEDNLGSIHTYKADLRTYTHVTSFEGNDLGVPISPGAGLGSSVALDDQGVLLACGYPFITTGGEVRLYSRGSVDDDWGVGNQEITDASPAASDGFGSAVAISPDQEYLLIGANGKNSSVGEVQLWHKNGETTYSLAHTILASDPSNTVGFGRAVAFSEDASRIAIAIEIYNDGTNSTPVVETFNFNGNDVPTFDTRIYHPEGSSNATSSFARNISISANGRELFIADDNDQQVYAYDWAVQDTSTLNGYYKLRGAIGDDAANFGHGVAIGDQETSLIISALDSAGGIVYLFTERRPGGGYGGSASQGGLSDSSTWGNIQGTLANQLDLQAELDNKEPIIVPKESGFNKPFGGLGVEETVARGDHTHPSYDADGVTLANHISDTTIHGAIDDVTPSAVGLYSSNKIESLIAGLQTQIDELKISLGVNSQNIGANSAIDLNNGRYIVASPSANTTYTMTEPDQSNSFIVELHNAGSFFIDFTGVTWLTGTPPIYKVTGINLVSLFTVDNGATWLGAVAG